MKVARVVIHAPVTSFRHPFFVTGKQPTALFPPPSTIHGHCASALGAWPDPRTFTFGIHFTFRSRAEDLEHQYLTEAAGSKTRIKVPSRAGAVRATTEATVQPVLREFLFDASLTLYLNPELADAFRAPAYPMVLGRSQDLAEVVSAEVIRLRRAERARVEHTLLPWRLRPCVPSGTTVLLSRYISEPPAREALFERYVGLHDPVFLGGDPEDRRTVLRVDGIDWDDLWSDPDQPEDEGFFRGVWMHRLLESP